MSSHQCSSCSGIYRFIPILHLNTGCFVCKHYSCSHSFQFFIFSTLLSDSVSAAVMLCDRFLMETDLLSQIWYFRKADAWNRKAGFLCQKKPLLFGIMFVWSLSVLQIYPGIKSMHLGVSLMLSVLCVFVTKHHWSTQELMSASVLAASAAPFSVLGRIYLICLLETMKRVCEVHSRNKPTHIDETRWRSRLRSFFSFSSSNLSRLKTASPHLSCCRHSELSTRPWNQKSHRKWCLLKTQTVCFYKLIFGLPHFWSRIVDF